MLRAVTAQTGLSWEEVLPVALFAIRTNINRATGISPFEAVFGRPPTLPLDYLFGTKTQRPTTLHEFCNQQRAKIQETEDYARQHLHRYVRRRRAQYNKEHLVLKVGTKVWLYTPRSARGVPAKLSIFYTGPWIVHKHNKCDTLIDIKPDASWGDPEKVVTVSVDRVKPYGDNTYVRPADLSKTDDLTMHDDLWAEGPFKPGAESEDDDDDGGGYEGPLVGGPMLMPGQQPLAANNNNAAAGDGDGQGQEEQQNQQDGVGGAEGNMGQEDANNDAGDADRNEAAGNDQAPPPEQQPLPAHDDDDFEHPEPQYWYDNGAHAPRPPPSPPPPPPQQPPPRQPPPRQQPPQSPPQGAAAPDPFQRRARIQRSPQPAAAPPPPNPFQGGSRTRRTPPRATPRPTAQQAAGASARATGTKPKTTSKTAKKVTAGSSQPVAIRGRQPVKRPHRDDGEGPEAQKRKDADPPQPAAPSNPFARSSRTARSPATTRAGRKTRQPKDLQDYEVGSVNYASLKSFNWPDLEMSEALLYMEAETANL